MHPLFWLDIFIVGSFWSMGKHSIQRKKICTHSRTFLPKSEINTPVFYTPHLWRAQHQTTTYGVFYQDRPNSKGFAGNYFFQQKKEVQHYFFRRQKESRQFPRQSASANRRWRIGK